MFKVIGVFVLLISLFLVGCSDNIIGEGIMDLNYSGAGDGLSKIGEMAKASFDKVKKECEANGFGSISTKPNFYCSEGILGDVNGTFTSLFYSNLITNSSCNNQHLGDIVGFSEDTFFELACIRHTWIECDSNGIIEGNGVAAHSPSILNHNFLCIQHEDRAIWVKCEDSNIILGSEGYIEKQNFLQKEGYFCGPSGWIDLSPLKKSVDTFAAQR